MKITNKLSVAAVVMTGVIATGCSQQTSQIEAAAQIEAPVAAAVVVPRAAPAPAPVMKAKPRPNRWAHHHPEAPACAKTKSHTHQHHNMSGHRHHYACQQRMAKKAKPQVDVHALQRKLKSKGFYKGPIDGVVGPSTRDALQRFMQR